MSLPKCKHGGECGIGGLCDDCPMMESPSGIEKAVCEDIAARQQLGIEKYGTTVANNPLPLKEWLQHAYEETLDKAIYLKRAIAEMENAELSD